MTENEEPIEEVETEGEPTDEEVVDLEEPCIDCQLNELIASVALAHSACEMVDDPDQRIACKDWASQIDPENITNFKDVARETVKRAGVKSFIGVTKVYNDVIQDAIIEVTKEQIDAGEQVDPDTMRVYRGLLLKRGL